MRSTLATLAAAAATLMSGFADTPAAAQDIHITPSLGAFHAGQNLDNVRRAADDGRLTQNAPLAFGLALEAFFLRGTVLYASGATIDAEGAGLGGTERIGDGSLFAAAADVVFRPIPRLIVIQPYVLGGIGFKHERYSFEDDAIGELLPDRQTRHAWHIGVGADLMFGNLGVVAEVTDFIDREGDGFLGRHDSFAMIGLRLRLR